MPETVMVPIDQLKLWDKNPRRISDASLAALKASLTADPGFLWLRPILALKDGTVFAGNQRLTAARALGWKEVPCIQEDIPEQLMHERAIKDNNEYGEWEPQALNELLAGITLPTIDLGFSADELERLLRGLAPKEGKTDPDNIPEVDEPFTKYGDLWLLGEHRVLCGDSTKESQYSNLDCMWTDPPYGVSYTGKTKDAMKIQNDGEEGLPKLLADTFAIVNQILVDGAPIYIARPSGRLAYEFTGAFINAGWQFHQELQWCKDSMVLGHSDYHLQHETIMYGWKSRDGGRSGRGNHEGTRWHGGNDQTSIFNIPRPKRSTEHPTSKPVELVLQQVRNSTAQNETVYDPFLGSGTTLIACEQLGRKCYGVEIEPKYVDVIVRRWELFTGRKAELAT